MRTSSIIRLSLLAMLVIVADSCVRKPRHHSDYQTVVNPRPSPTPLDGENTVTPVTGTLSQNVYNLAQDVYKKVSAGAMSNADIECWSDLYKEYTKEFLKTKDALNDIQKEKIAYNLEVVDKVIIQNPVGGSAQWTNYLDEGFQLPPYTFPAERKHSHWYYDGNDNLAMLEEACDYNFPYTKAFANHFAAMYEGSYNIWQVCSIYKFCIEKWRYVNDPDVGTVDYVARASESIAASLTGDCDDFAVLLTTCVIAIGGNARIVVATNTSTHQGHAYSEVDITNMDFGDVKAAVKKIFPSASKDLCTRKQDGKIWLNLDWQRHYPGGPYWEADDLDFYYMENGNWKWHN